MDLAVTAPHTRTLPVLSVVIACRDAETTLATQLEALARQEWNQPWEVVLADNGSSDASLAVATRYHTRLQLKVIDASAWPGAAYARNRGVEAASGELLAFCDADDEVGPGWVAAMGRALREHAFVCGRLRFDRFSRPTDVARRDREWRRRMLEPGGPLHAATCNLGVHRSLHGRIGGFDPRFLRAADTDYCWRLRRLGVRLVYTPDAVVQYRNARTNRSLRYRITFARRNGEAHYLLYRRHGEAGMPPARQLTEWPLRWRRLLAQLPRLCASRSGCRAWLRKALREGAYVVGLLQGRVKGLSM